MLRNEQKEEHPSGAATSQYVRLESKLNMTGASEESCRTDQIIVWQLSFYIRKQE